MDGHLSIELGKHDTYSPTKGVMQLENNTDTMTDTGFDCDHDRL